MNPVQASNNQLLDVFGRRSISFSALLVGDFRAYAGTVEACLRKPESECGGASVDGAWTGWMISPLQDYSLVWTIGYLPGVLKAGRYEAHQAATDLGTLKYASGAAFTLDLD